MSKSIALMQDLEDHENLVPVVRKVQTRLTRIIMVRLIYLCDALRDLVPIVQFKKLEKHPWGSVNFSKVADSLQLY